MALVKRRLTFSSFLLILVNLVPIYGVLFEGWDAGQVFLIYCLETIMIGIANVFKMIAVSSYQKTHAKFQGPGRGGVFIILFFIIHYGIFVFIQTQIFFKLSQVIESNQFFVSYKTIFQALGDEGKLLLGIFALYYTIDFLFDFIGTGKYQNEEMSDLMFRPYGRIFVQQFVVILGGFFLLFKANSLFIILFIGIKIFFEYLVTTGNFLPARNKNKWNAAYEEH